MKCSYNKDWETAHDWVKSVQSEDIRVCVFLYHLSALVACPTLSHANTHFVLVLVCLDLVTLPIDCIFN